MRLNTSSSQREVLQRTRRAVGQSCTTCTRRAVTVSSWRRMCGLWSAVAEAGRFIAWLLITSGRHRVGTGQTRLGE